MNLTALRQRIIMRPLPDDKGWLFFPYGYRGGGQGYIVTDEQQARPLGLWSSSGHGLIVATFLIVAMLGCALGRFSVGGMLSGLAFGAVFATMLYRYWKRLVTTTLPQLEPASYCLTENRYWQELAGSLSRWQCYGHVGFTIVLVLALLTSVSVNGAVLLRSWPLAGLHIAALLWTLHRIAFAVKTLRWRKYALKRGITAGSMDDLPEC